MLRRSLVELKVAFPVARINDNNCARIKVKVKDKVRSRAGHEGQEGSRGIALLFLLPRRLTPRKDTWYALSRRLGGPKGRSLRVRKVSPHRVFSALAKLWKVTISFVMSVCLSAWNNSVPSGRILKKLDIWAFFGKSLEKIQVSLKSDQNNGYFTRRRFHIFDGISLNSS
jgi:hypothetical protein